jgi:single-strand DNA-binding protein
MAKDLNKVMLIGRLGTEPELRYTQQGVSITTFRMAISRQWRDSDGNQRDDTEWFTVVTWNRLAEICAEYLHKGARVYVEGRLQNRSWDDSQTGDKRYRTEIVANDMIMLDQRGGERHDQGYDIGSERSSGGSFRTSGHPSSGNRHTYDHHGDFSDEDIPF